MSYLEVRWVRLLTYKVVFMAVVLKLYQNCVLTPFLPAFYPGHCTYR